MGLIFTVYSNTLTAAWQLDDLPNIVENTKLQIEGLSFKTIFQTFFADPRNTNKLYRPIPCFTFAMNFFFSKYNVGGYHLVNIFIHFSTAFFLFLTIFNLLKIPLFCDRYKGKEHIIALTASLLWALNPLQTQAVTYIVQRMASMAAMFSIIGIYCYIMAQSSRYRLLFYICCTISFLFALGSKENAIIYPFSLLLIKIVFFRVEKTKRQNKTYRYAISMVIILILFGTVYFSDNSLFPFFVGYKERGFTLIERMLTEPRILVFYISQLFFPLPNRLSIEHDVVASTSLFHPWTTLPSILLVFILIGTGFFFIKKKPILSFTILFFFLNHLVESTLLPLELIFEHRNYLPSLFIFLPIAISLIKLSERFKDNKKTQIAVNCFILFLIAGSGVGTYIRNMAWATEITLWTDAMKKAPGRARPLFMVAKYRYHLKGELDKAHELYEKAFHSKASSPNISKAMCLNGMAGIAFKQQDYEKALRLSHEALNYNQNSGEAKFNIVLTLLKDNQFNTAMEVLEKFYGETPRMETYMNFKGLILLGQNKPLEAILIFDAFLKKDPYHWRSILNKGVALSRSGHLREADSYLLKAVEMNPTDINSIFFLLENSVRTNDKSKIDRDIGYLTTKFDIHFIKAGLNGKFRSGFTPNLNKNILEPVILQKFDSFKNSNPSENDRMK